MYSVVVNYPESRETELFLVNAESRDNAYDKMVDHLKNLKCKYYLRKSQIQSIVFDKDVNFIYSFCY